MRLRLWCAAVLLAAAGVAFVAGSASAATLLGDDFTDGDAAGWSTSGGAWSVSGGAYRQTGFTAGQAGVATYYADAAFDDVLVESAGSGPPSPTASPTVPPPSGVADGFASVAALGLSGTTGGAGGPTVTVSSTDELLDAIDTIGPMTIQVAGRIAITSKQGVRPDKTIVGIGSSPTIAGGGFDFYRSSNMIVRNLTFDGAEDDATTSARSRTTSGSTTTRSSRRSTGRSTSSAARTM
jgi:pectate lyase